MPKTDFTTSFDDYAPVAERVRLFYERYPAGRIITHLVSRSDEEIVFRAEAFRLPGDREPSATGWAAERQGDGDINTVACLENTETSAIGRALANLGLAASRQRPSAEEMRTWFRRRARHPHAVNEIGDATVETRTANVARRDEAIQQAADNVMDALSLLAEAERAGFDAVRADEMREELLHPHVPPSGVTRVERAVRRWLVALDRDAGAPAAQPDSSTPPARPTA